MHIRKNQALFIAGAKYSFWGMLFVLLSGCLDTIDIETPANNIESLVIQGKLVVGAPSTIQVNLSRLFNFTAESKRPVNARSVILFDENNNSIALEDYGLGNYFLSIPADHPDFSIQLGRSYGIEVRTFDGRTFESSLEQANPVPVIESINYRIVEREVINLAGTPTTQQFLQYTVNTPLRTSEADKGVRLGWEYLHTFKVNDTPFQPNIEQKTCYVTQNLNVTDIKVVDAGALSSTRLEDYELFQTMITGVYGEGLYFTLIQESLSETAYEYFSQIEENTGRTGNMFEAPPGKVVTNLRNTTDEQDEVFGFFYVTQQDTLRRYVSPASVGNPPPSCPPPGGLINESGNCTTPVCCDCLGVPNSTVIRPAYWVE